MNTDTATDFDASAFVPDECEGDFTCDGSQPQRWVVNVPVGIDPSVFLHFDNGTDPDQPVDECQGKDCPTPEEEEAAFIREQEEVVARLMAREATPSDRPWWKRLFG